MRPDDFRLYFEALHSVAGTDRLEPFPWQERLAQRVLSYGWGNGDDPDNEGDGRTDLLALPTAAGKTAVIDIAVFHLALQLHRRVQPRAAPLRVFFVVDRRIVVDEAYQRARRIADALREATGGILKTVADALRSMGGSAPLDEPLQVAVMRGGTYRDDSWAASPVQPTVCVSTVDQVGSRLLFRGYGLSHAARPIHAGLIGCDSLIILDEAHISNPFLETLARVRRYASPEWAEVPSPGAPLQVVQMTATPRAGVRPFTISDIDRANRKISRRLTAQKRAELLEVSTSTTTQAMSREERRQVEETNREALVDRIVAAALRLATAAPSPPAVTRRRRAATTEHTATSNPAPVRVIGIVVNRVAIARSVFERIGALGQEDGAPPRHVILLTGRIRPYDRDELLYRAEVDGQPCGWLRYMRANRPEIDQLDRLLFVVATQTVEVGADLSFDALVTEVASLDALRQRFGRLDRLGRRGFSAAVIVACKHAVAASAKPDRVYGDALRETWKQLNEKEWASVNGRGSARTAAIDFGIDALQSKIDDLRQQDPEAFERLLAPAKHAPVLLPAHLDTWCQTSPSPAADPDVALFLHGPESTPADVQVVWRADLPQQLGADRLAEYVSTVNLVPPTSLETLPVPFYEVRRWLDAAETEGEVSDVEGVATDESTEEPQRSRRAAGGTLVLRWCGPESTQTQLVTPGEIGPGQTIIVPAELGGCDQFGWSPQSRSRVRDMGDAAARLARWRPVLRLHPQVVAAWYWPTPEAEGFAESLLSKMRHLGDSDDGDSETTPDFDGVLELIRDESRVPQWARYAATEMLPRRLRRQPVPYPGETGVPGWLLERRRRLTRDQIVTTTIELEADRDVTSEGDCSSWTTGRAVGLIPHLEAVRDRVDQFAGALIAGGTRGDLVMAGWLHDVGKADPRFQVWLYDGDEVAFAAAGELLAKSGNLGRDRAASGRTRQRAGYPAGGRHECLSVQLLAENPSVIAEDRDRELVMYLVGAHHGFGRAFMPVVRDPSPTSAELRLAGHQLRAPCDHRLYALDSGWTDRFWALVRRYGYWTLAYFEAIVRLADQAVSRGEQRTAEP